MQNKNINAVVILMLVGLVNGAIYYFTESPQPEKSDTISSNVILKETEGAIEDETIEPIGKDVLLEEECKEDGSCNNPSELNVNIANDLNRENAITNWFDEEIAKTKAFRRKYEDSLGLDEPNLKILREITDDALQANKRFQEELSQVVQNPDNLYVMITSEQELSEEQLALRLQVIDSINETQQQNEQNRISFEDSLSTLLDSEQLEAYKQMERDAAISQRQQHMDIVLRSFENSISNITDQQRDSFSQIAQKYESYGLDQIPVGSSIQIDRGATTNETLIVKNQEFDQEIYNVLTYDQQQQFHSSAKAGNKTPEWQEM